MGQVRQTVLGVAGREVVITNPDKVIFPQAGHTKLDLVKYYAAVAEAALRGIAARPLVLKRYVNGAEREPFFQKRAPEQRPEWVETVELRFPSGRTAREIVVRDAAQLLWIVNLGCIDLNPHPVRADDLEHPDELRVDLDPGPGTSWDDVRRVALIVRDVLDEHRLRGWPKTSGSRGMHIYVRIHRRWSFDQVRRATLALAREGERRAPGQATSKWWKEERHGVFLDYNQNAKDRTVASALSGRPTPDAPVATPPAVDPTPHHGRQGSAQRGRARRPRTVEGTPSGGCGAAPGRRRARRLDARPLIHVDADPDQLAPCPRKRALCRGTARSRLRSLARLGAGAARGAGAEDPLELVGGRDLQLIVAAVLRSLVGSPAHELRGMPEARPLHVAVRDLADALGPKRLPAQVLAAVPAAARPGQALPRRVRFRLRLRPVAPGMAFQRVSPQRRPLGDELLAHDVGERRGDADVVQCATVVVEAQQERADHRPHAVLVPAEAGDHAVGCARVLDLDHRALARAVRRIQTLGHHTVEPGALEATEPVRGEGAVARRR